MRFEDTNGNFTGENYNLNGPHYESNIFNQSPDFKEANENELIIGNDSAANGIGDPVFAGQVPNDILGKPRIASPDAGAYQHEDF